MSTALALVNRMRVKRRTSTQAAITDREGVAYLEILNGAIETVLEQRTWDFQRRVDGIIVTIPPFSGSTLNVIAGATAIAATPHTGTTADVAGSFVTRLRMTGDTQYANTTFPLVGGYVSVGNMIGTMASAWPGATYSSTWRTCVWEYVLPATVRQVLNVWNQETPISLMFEDETHSFEQMVPRPHEMESDYPEWVMVGGEVANTADESIPATSAFGLALKVYPVPSAELVLNYSYIYRQPALSVLTDTLNRVPPVVESLIVDLSTARVMAFLEKDIATGLPLEAKVLKQIDQVHRNHLPAPTKRSSMRSFDHIGAAGDPNWPPSTVESL